jgi:hypothetical protein
MLRQAQFLLIKIIDRYYLKKRKIKLIQNKRGKNVLVSYVLVPQSFLGFYFKSSHNNRIQCYLIMKFLRRKGYNIFLHPYFDKEIDYSIKYDLFIGHNFTFAEIAEKLRDSCKKVLIATGSEPNFGNNQQKLRIDEVNKRKHTSQFVYDGNIVSDLSLNYEIADRVLMLGNEFVRNTYDQKYHSKIRLVNNVTLHPFFSMKSQERTNNFLFISSVGQIHRGLDLLLDIFPGLTNKLYVMSSFDDEKEFVDLYYKELYQTANIIPVGYLPLNSIRFREIINDVDFVILPSCSEGQSSSVINIMAYGKLPVVPENVGIPEIEEIGIKIETVDLHGVLSAVQKAIALSDEDITQKQKKLTFHNRLYTPHSFTSCFEAIVA